MTVRRLCCRVAAFALFSANCFSAPPTINGCQVFPSNNYWNTPIDQLPLHPSSATWVNSVGANTGLHADWGNVLADNYGIPYVTVPGTQPKVPVSFLYFDESDPGPYPIPPNAPIEGGAASNGDRHVLTLDTTNCILYELYRGFPQNGGSSWNADSGVVFPLNSNASRPDTWTSADAAGFAVLPGLVRWDEVAAGEINHAIRFTAQNIWGSLGGGLHKYLWPARHWSGNTNNPAYPPMGARFRLKANVDISKYQPATQVVLRAMQRYGLVLADGGSNWYFSGVSDTRWPDLVIDELSGRSVPIGTTKITGSSFEVVDTSLLQINPDSALAVQVPDAPTNVAAVPANGQASFSFTAPANGGAPITVNMVACTSGMTTLTGTAMTSPVAVAGMTNGVQYACTVRSANATGYGPASASILVTTGLPALSVAPSALSFAARLLNTQSATQVITVTNSGSGNLTLGTISLAGPQAGAFSRTGTCAAGGVLMPQQQCSINIAFTPLTAGPTTASLEITSSGAGGSGSISLSGTGFTIPGAPVITKSVAGDGQVSLFFSPPTLDGGAPITGYTANCGPAGASAPGLLPQITVTGLTNGATYSCSVYATNTAGDGPVSATVMVMPSATANLDLIAVMSRKTHAAAGVHDLPIDLTPDINGNITVEPRLGPTHTIAFVFNKPVLSVGSVTALTPLAAQAGTSITALATGFEAVVTIFGVADNRRARITLGGVNGEPINFAASIGFLAGDANSSRTVTASDISAIKTHMSPQPIDRSSYRLDLDTSGFVTSSDLTLAKQRSGQTLQ